MKTPERKGFFPVEKKEEEFVVPEGLKDSGIAAVETAYKATVKDGKKTLTQSPQTKQVVITIPKTQSDLDDLSKGKSSSSITWFALFWLRMIKKALHLGKQVAYRKGK